MENLKVLINIFIGLIILMTGVYLIHIYELGEIALEICWALFLLLLINLYTKNQDKARKIEELESKIEHLEERLKPKEKSKRVKKKDFLEEAKDIEDFERFYLD